MNEKNGFIDLTLRESAQIRSFSWSVLSRIQTEYGDLLRKSTYSVRMRENTDQIILRICTLFTQCQLPVLSFQTYIIFMD